MRKRDWALLFAFALVLIVAGGLLWNILHRGLSARDEPTRVETIIARTLRHFSYRGEVPAKNPVAATPDVIASAKDHWADHCASCHANDGSGDTEMGRNMYPKPPDMRLKPTQELSDGEIFLIIRNGVRLTGMPAWGDGSSEADAETWELVHFVRYLPKMPAAEAAAMTRMNPVSASVMEEQREIHAWLDGCEDAPAAATEHEEGHH